MTHLHDRHALPARQGPDAGLGAAPASTPADGAAPGYPDDHGPGRLRRIADALTALHKLQFGRGPERCQAFFAGADVVVCLVEGSMGVAERRLVALGEAELVRAGRLLALDAARDELQAIVAAVLEREVQLSISGTDVRRDVATVTFLLGGAATAAP